jgi:hypothetical protein
MKADMNENVEGLYLGSVSAATDFEALQSHGITHVICAAKDLVSRSYTTQLNLIYLPPFRLLLFH